MSLEVEIRVGRRTELAIEILRHNQCLDNQQHQDSPPYPGILRPGGDIF